MAVEPIPEGYEKVTPYLICIDAAKAIDFYKKAFGATELMRFPGPGGCIMHAEIRIDGSHVMRVDEFPKKGARSPTSFGGSPVVLLLYGEDVDARFDRTVAAGAKVERPVKDQPYGDRSGTREDPFGHLWTLATRKENPTPEGIRKRLG